MRLNFTPIAANRRPNTELSNEHKGGIIATRSAALSYSKVARVNSVMEATAYAAV